MKLKKTKQILIDLLRGTLSLRRQEKAMIWIFPILLIIPNIWLCFTEHTHFISKLTNIVLPFGFFVFLMSLSRKVGRTLLFCLPFLMYAAFQVVLLHLYGESIIATDMLLSVVTSNPGEAKELLGNLLAALVAIFVLYLPPICWATVCVVKKTQLSSDDLLRPRRASKVLVILGVLLLANCYLLIPDFSINREIFPVNVIRNTVEAAHRTYLTYKYPETSQDFTYAGMSSRRPDQKEIYVLVIGETSRADNWQLLGYGRPTNPLLSQRDNLLVFNKALTESNTTHKTVPMLLSHLDANNYGDSIYSTKSIISAFNDAGYTTAFISTQRHNRSFIDHFSNDADIEHFLVEEGHPQMDHELTASLRQLLRDTHSNKIFVILHAYGSHFNYRDRYPAEYSYFKPDNYTTANSMVRDNLVNAYDNTIRYTDKMLDDIITMLENENCVSAMVYLSDHGEDIYDDSRLRFLHSSPTPTFYQLHVPLIVWMSDSLLDNYPDKFIAAHTIQNNDVSTGQSIFHSILDVAGISSPFLDKERSIFSRSYQKPHRIFINDYNEAVPLDESGLKEQDFTLFNQLGISHN